MEIYRQTDRYMHAVSCRVCVCVCVCSRAEAEQAQTVAIKWLLLEHQARPARPLSPWQRLGFAHYEAARGPRLV